MSKSTMIYFLKPVGLDGPIKIGCSNCPKDRLMAFAVWSPFPLEFIGSVAGNLKDEGWFHKCFADIHSHSEWFFSTPRLTEAIKLALTSGSLEPLRSRLQPCGSIRNKRKRAPITADRRKYLSYESRIRHAQLRIRGDRGANCAWYAPDDIRSALYSWSHGKEPSPEQVARFIEYLANPIALSVVPGWHRPKVAA